MCLAAGITGSTWSPAVGVAHAQAAGGVGDDAIPVPRGGVRVRIAGEWRAHDALFTGAGGRRPLLGPLAGDAFGVRQLPQLAGAEAAIRDLSGDGGFTLSLGALQARGSVRQSVTPITLDVGLTRRVAIGVVVPYIESRDITQFVLNPTGTSATVGRNPALTPGTAGAARAANGQLLRQLDRAQRDLTAEIARCADPAATGCDALRSDPSGAQALLARSASALGSIATVYGDSLRAGAAVVPVSGSVVQAAVQSTLDALRGDFLRFGITSLDASSRPAGATDVYGPGSMDAIGGDSALGLAYERLGNSRRAGIGDVDVTASVLVYDSFGADQHRRLAASGLAVRSLVTVGWRFGSATADRAEDAFDATIGDGVQALLLRNTTDLVLHRRLWVSGTVRVVQPFTDEIATRIPPADDSTVFFPGAATLARRSLGRRLELEVAPRLVLNDYFGLSGALLLRQQGDDRYEGIARAPEALALTASAVVPARSVRAASFGVTFATLASYARGRARLPVEVVYTHTESLGASGGLMPVVSSDRIELRYFFGFPRR
jgi:hypothetical protein